MTGIKQHDQKQLKEEKISPVYKLQSIIKGSQDRRSLKAETDTLLCWKAAFGLLSLLSYSEPPAQRWH